MRVIGMLSGTSVDGVNCAYCEIDQVSDINGHVHYRPRLIAYSTYAWEQKYRDMILELIEQRDSDAVFVQRVCRVNFELGWAFGHICNRFMKDHNIDASSVAVIGSHGQTVWHDRDGESITSTLQIGESACIAKVTGITVVDDFRKMDVSYGGHGAPLTSILDYAIQDMYQHHPQDLDHLWTAVQNIGGMANVTLLPPGGIRDSGSIVGFDSGPGNVLIDWAASWATDGSMSMDEDGQMARLGTVNEKLLALMVKHEYFSLPPPKTTGRELFGSSFAQKYARIGREEMNMSKYDIVATFTELTAFSIVDSIVKYAPQGCRLGKMVISGGGSFNTHLVERIRVNFEKALISIDTPSVMIMTHDSFGINADAKEAMLFAYLAYLCTQGVAGSLPSVTGADEPVVLGKITPGRNFNQVMLSQSELTDDLPIDETLEVA